MTTIYSSQKVSDPTTAASLPRFFRGGFTICQSLVAGLALLLQTGCETVSDPPAASVAPTPATAAPSDEVPTLKAGDVVKISFPGVPNMDVTQPIRADGKLSLPLAGDIVAVGKSTEEFNNELLEIYATKLVSKEVTVSLMSSPYPVYVTGAVLRPGKIVAERRITVFDAVMEAGGFDKAKAKLNAVKVVRQENGQSQSYTVDLQKMLSGQSGQPFYLKPYDTVYVPEKFNWF